MGWADLLSTQTEQLLPWTGGRSLVGRRRKWKLSGALPDEVGWHRFAVDGSRRARWLGEGTVDPDFAQGRKTVRGYLIGDRLIPDGCAVRPDVRQALEQTEPVWLVERGLDRFARVLTVRSGGRLIYLQQEFPQGPELEVIEAWQDRAESVAHIPGVPPALELAFLWLVWQRRLAAEAQQRREAAARLALAGAIPGRPSRPPPPRPVGRVRRHGLSPPGVGDFDRRARARADGHGHA